MADLDYAPVMMADEEEERKRDPFALYPPVKPPAQDLTTPLPPDLSGARIPEAPSITTQAQPSRPEGPATLRERALLEQGPPQYHGWKKALDVLGRVTAPGAGIEERTGLGTLGYQSRLGRAAGAAREEQAQAKAPLDLEKEQAATEEQKAKATQEKARAEALLHPPVKPKEEVWKVLPGMVGPGGKVLQEEQNSGQIRWAPQIEGVGPLKEPAEKPEAFPGITGDIKAMFPPPERAQFKTDAEFTAARQAWGKKVNDYIEKQKTREAIAGRAPLQREYSVLDTANGNAPAYVTPELMAAAPGRYIPAGPGATALNKTALIEDIRGTVGKARDAVERMGNEGFDKKQRAWIAAGLAAPAGQTGQYMESLLREPLTDAQQDYIVALFQMKENAMAMRSVLGAGQGSEDMRAAIAQTLPGAGTPSKAFFKKQVDAIENTLNRLERGVPNVPLKPKPAEVSTGGQHNEGDERTNRKTGEVQKFTKGQWQTIKPATRQ